MALFRLALALLGLPLFVFAALAAFWAFRQAGLDGAVLMLEFRRLGEYPELAALPVFAAAALMIDRASVPAELNRCADTQGALASVAIGLAAPGLTLLVFAAAAAILAPATAPEHADLLRAGLPAALGALSIALAIELLNGRLDFRTIQDQGRSALRFFWPAFALLLLLYLEWLNAITVAALLFTWSLKARRRRVAWDHIPKVFAEAAVRTMPSLLVLGLSLAASATWQHRVNWPGVVFDDFLTLAIGQGIVCLLSAAAAALTATMIRHSLAAMALIAPPAIVLAQTINLSLLLQGLGLAVAIALGTRTGVQRAGQNAPCLSEQAR